MDDLLPSHVAWVMDRLGPRLEAELRRQDVSLSVRESVEVMCAADPTAKKLAVQWLAERFLDGGYLWEDVRAGAASKVHDTLVAFGTHRRKLSGSGRHLSGHPSLASAWKAVAHLVPKGQDSMEPGIRERRRLERTAARSESIILCERPGLTVAVPLTEAASKWWGRGTRWCTAADEDNAFGHYNESAPLLVIVLADTKLQLHLEPGEVCRFMDADDAAVDPDFVEERWSDLEGVVRWALSVDPTVIKYMPVAAMDRETCMDAVSRYGSLLVHVPDAMTDRGICLAAMRQSGALRHVPRELRDREICEAAIERSWDALLDVPDHLLDRDLCLKAVRQDGGMLTHVPQEMRDREMCTEAMRAGCGSLNDVPEEFRDRVMVMEAVGRQGRILREVPAHLQDTEMCLIAVRQRSSAIAFVASGLINRDLCIEAVRRGGAALWCVPESLRDPEMYVLATDNDPDALGAVPIHLRTRDMCLKAVGRNVRAFDFVPVQFRDQELLEIVVRHRPTMLRQVPAERRSRSLCMSAVEGNGLLLREVPFHLRDREVCIQALRNGAALNGVPEALRDSEMLRAIKPLPVRWTAAEALSGLEEALRKHVPSPQDSPVVPKQC